MKKLLSVMIALALFMAILPIQVNAEEINYAFNRCNKLTSIIIPDSVTFIGDYAFFIWWTTSPPTTYYSGSEEQWKQIAIGENNMLDFNRHYNSTGACNYVSILTAPTCNEQGYTTYTCTDCFDSYIDNYVDTSGHTELKDAAIAATCTTTSKTEGSHCSVCGTVIVAQQTVPAKGHTEVIDAGIAATCTTAGKTEGKHCSVCNTVIVEQQNVPATGHTYGNGVDGTCNGCGIHREETEDRTVMHMFRMYDPNSGEHFYTGSEEERENLVAAGWNYEGVGFTFSRTTGLPVYRLYDPITGEHLYTMQQPVKTGTQYEGKDLYECEGRIWLYEGIAFNSAYDTEVPQYRLRNPNATRGAYHFTSSTEECDNLIAAGWISEGICFYSSWK